MARARNIKPGFFTNEDLLECEPLARILFIGLWCLADREGRLEDRPRKIKIEILPCDECNIDVLLQQLHDRDMIIRYVVGTDKYIQIKSFSKHQNPHVKESASTIPAQDECDTSPDKHLPRLVQAPDKHHASPAESLLLIPEKEKTNKKEIQEFVLPEWIPSSDWNDFSSMRQRLRKPMTRRAMQLIVDELDKLRKQGHPPALVLQQSIRKSWQDVFPIKREGPPNAPPRPPMTQRRVIYTASEGSS